MKNINLELVQSKLNQLLDYINELKYFETLTLAEFLSERHRQFTIERIIELIVQTAIDINKYILKKKGVNLTNLTSHQTFVEMSKFEIITQLLAEEIKESVDTRNVLAHRYFDISPEEVFVEIEDVLEKYPRYVRQIETFSNSLQDSQA
ncbi:MAG: DUF86 domain-containing protein [Pseudanabaena sp. ELA645]|jgi:uncharacterized protein YutE (UPF0331/DUF86 family)